MIRIYLRMMEIGEGNPYIWLGKKGADRVYGLPVLTEENKLSWKGLPAIADEIKKHIREDITVGTEIELVTDLPKKFKERFREFVEILEYFGKIRLTFGKIPKWEDSDEFEEVGKIVHNKEWWSGYGSIRELEILPEWKDCFKKEFEFPYFKKLEKFLKAEVKWTEDEGEGLIIPPIKMIFRAYGKLKPEDVTVVIIGQDPYPNKKNAMGWSFSVPRGEKIPGSLRNVYKELEDDPDVFFENPEHGDLSGWVSQGVFLVNISLTVSENQPRSHLTHWGLFTIHIISWLAEKFDNIVFMLWGKDAQECRKVIPVKKHLVLEAMHPSARVGEGFVGCRHFSKANDYLERMGRRPIDWSLL